MSDLREALEWWFAPRPEPLSMSRREALLVDHLAHAARRFLALTETGPDYEAAAKKLWWWSTNEEWEDIEAAVFVDDIWRQKARSIVDAAIGELGE